MISIREIRDLKEAEALWRSLSPGETIFDEWEFRFCFYKYTPLPLCFLAAYEQNDKKESKIKPNTEDMLLVFYYYYSFNCIFYVVILN